jgi:phosphoribosylanthranilate isomerase
VALKIKICGITRLKDAQLCVEYGVDAIGFVFYRKSKRYITPDEAYNIAKSLPIFTHKVGVFVNESYNEVNNIAESVGLTAVQLHGNESPEYTAEIKHPVIKAFGVDKNFDFSQTTQYTNSAILLDVKNTMEYGGTGKSFDWKLIPKSIRNRVIVAGGISARNIKNMYNTIAPYAVDLSSSVEIEPGIKDAKKIIEIMNIIKQINNKNE